MVALPTKPKAKPHPVPKRKADGTDKLARLASEMNAAHEAAENAARERREKYRAAGLKLIEARGECERRDIEWLPWLKTSAKFSKSTAYRYIKFAERFPVTGNDAEEEAELRRIQGNDRESDDTDAQVKPVVISDTNPTEPAGEPDATESEPTGTNEQKPDTKPQEPKPVKPKAKPGLEPDFDNCVLKVLPPELADELRPILKRLRDADPDVKCWTVHLYRQAGKGVARG